MTQNNNQRALLFETLSGIMDRLDNIEQTLEELKTPKEETEEDAPSRYTPEPGLYWVWLKEGCQWTVGYAEVMYTGGCDDDIPRKLRCLVSQRLSCWPQRYSDGVLYALDNDDIYIRFIQNAFDDIRWIPMSSPNLDTVLLNSKPNGLFAPTD